MAADVGRLRASGLDVDNLIGHLAVVAALGRGEDSAGEWFKRFEDRGGSREELLAAIREHQSADNS